MKKIFLPLLAITIAVTGILLSCKKEKSCEGCINGNKPPTAVAGPDQVIALPTDSTSLDGSSSNDPDGIISEWLWTKISGPASFNIGNGATAKTVVRNLVTGIYKFELLVKDNGGLSARDTIQVTIISTSPTNHPPIANAGADQTITLPTNTITLNGSASTDQDHNISSYLWTKISGPSSFTVSNGNAVQTQVTNLVQGVYQFELKVTDAGGLFSKDTVQVTITNQPPPLTITCEPTNRPIINAQLIPVGNLSIARYDRHMATVSAGNKLFFAGAGSRVDIYDLSTETWSTAELSQARSLIGAATIGNKVFFAGGASGSGLSSRVDIYDLTTQTWSIAELSQARAYIETATIGNKVFFAGGQGSSRVDIYDLSTNSWSTANLSEAKWGFTATVANDKIYFAGGCIDDGLPASTKIDIYDNATGTWSMSTLSTPKAFHAAIFNNEKIYWAGGATEMGPHGDGFGDPLTCHVEIKDINSQVSSFSNLSYPKYVKYAFQKNNKIGFFGSSFFNPSLGCECVQDFDVYDLSSNSWSVAILPHNISICGSLISLNNTIYIAGQDSNSNCDYVSKVWRLEF